MKKCRQCGMLSADTATMCRHCKVKFTEEDKPIVVKKAKNNKSILTALTITVAVLVIVGFIVYQTGILKTWMQSSDKLKIETMATEFVNADFERDTKKVSSYMFDQYISYHKQQGTFVLDDNQYVSFYFSMYNPDVLIDVLSVNTDFLSGDFEIYSDEITSKYPVTPEKIVCVTAEVKITDNEFSNTLSAPMTFIELDGEWFILPIL